MGQLFQYIFDGLGQGSVLSLLALGLVIVFRATGHLNIAQGAMALVCAYAVYQFGEWGLPLFVAVPLGVLLGFLLGGLTERLLVRPLISSNLRVFIATLALMQFLDWLVTAIWGNQLLPDFTSQQTTYPAVFPDANTAFVRLFGATWRYEYIGILAATLLIGALLAVMFTRTKTGLAMRMISSNTEGARLAGVAIDRVQMLSWALAGALGGFGGIVLAGTQHNISPSLTTSVFLYAATAATLGGFDSPVGALLAGLVVGVVENVVAGYAPVWIGQQMRTSVAFLVLVVVLAIRPAGLFGTAKVERA